MRKIVLIIAVLFGVNISISANEVDKEAVSDKNLIANGSFEELESAPTEPNGPSGTWYNTDLWTDDTKATEWDFQKWNIDQPIENFNADVIKDASIDGENAVKLTVKGTNSNTQAFFKQMEIPVEANTYYEMSFWSKLEDVVGKQAIIRIEQYDFLGTKVASNDFQFGLGSTGWVKQTGEFQTKANAATINVVFVIPSSTTGSISLDQVELEQQDTSLTELTLDPNDITLSIGDTEQMTVGYIPEYTSQKDVIWSTSDETVATVNEDGLVTPVGPGQTTITVESATDSAISASTRVTVVEGDILVSDLEIVGGDTEIENGKKRFLDYQTYPSNAVNSDLAVAWSSSDNEIFSVDEDSGLIKAIGEGEATLSLSSVDNPDINTSVKITVVGDDTDPQFQLMKDRWTKRIIGDESLNLDNEYITDYVSGLDQEAQDLWAAMDKSADRTYLWPLQDGDTSSADITTQFTKINKLALAFGTKGSSLKENRQLYFDIQDALEFMTTTKNYNGTTGTSNWWDCQIGSAQQFTDTLMIMSDYMPSDKVEEYAKIISGYATDPSIQWGGYTATGANRTDIGISVLGTGILLEDPAKLELIDETIPDVFKLVTKGDGLYADGSVVQHSIFAYSGSYGNELIKGIGRILSTISDTEWEITDSSISNVYNTILEGYIPLVSDGRMMSMVSGRSVSRAPGTNKFASEYSAGAETIANMMVIANFAPQEQADIYNQNIKYYITQSSDKYNFFEHARDLEALQNADFLMSDSSIVPSNTFRGTKVYSMDKAVQSTDNYSVGISMYSNRTGNYELQTQGSGDQTKYENMRGWHQSDGVTYIYNDDYSSYDDGYWATIDSKRLPGTTVDTSDLDIGAGKGVKSNQSWVGGATDDNIGAVGMQLDKSTTGDDLNAKKSWFLLDGTIVALGSDINGTSDDSIQTVVENRKIGTETGRREDRAVVINDKVNDGVEQTSDYSSGSWMNIAGSTEDSSIGYYFPEDTNITTLSETNTDSFKSINTLFVNNKEYTDTYFKILINHGNNIENGSYSYMLLPGKNAEQTKQFAQENNIKILENDENVQAIADLDNGILAMNVWNPSGIDSKYISVDKPASIIVTSDDNNLSLTVSEPTREQDRVNIDLKFDVSKLVTSSSEIGVSNDLQSLVYYSPKDGSSATIELEVPRKLDFSKLEEAIKVAESIDQSQYTPNSVSKLNDEIVSAYAVLENATTQIEVDIEADNLNSAIDSLVKLADKDELNKLIKEAQSYEESDYESKSFSDLQSQLENAIEISENSNASQSEVNQAYSRLETAINDLKLNSGSIGETDNGSNDNNSTETNSSQTSSESITTLEKTGLYSGIGVIVLIGLIVIFYLKKKVNSI